MNTIFIVLPILTILMFELGLSLNLSDLKVLRNEPKSIIAGLIGQLIILPLLTFIIAYLFKMDSIYFIGLMLIACSPGGSSSNVFSMLAGGNVVLSVVLTALCSIITLFTLPIILSFVTNYLNQQAETTLVLPVGKLIVQNLVLVFIPIILGLLSKKFLPNFSIRLDNILSKVAFPALLLLATVFFIQHFDTIITEFGTLGLVIFALILSAMFLGYAISLIMKIKARERKTIIIEVGMQNAAQAIAIACSPFIFNNEVIAIPAIIYALMMNIILLVYIKMVSTSSSI